MNQSQVGALIDRTVGVLGEQTRREFAARDAAFELFRDELAAHLERLNGAHGSIVDMRSTLVSREKYEGDMARIRQEHSDADALSKNALERAQATADSNRQTRTIALVGWALSVIGPLLSFVLQKHL